MLEVTSAEYLNGYRIRVRFNDGRQGDADLSNALWGPMFEPLRDPAAFHRFQVSDVLHTIQWENGEIWPRRACLNGSSNCEILRARNLGERCSP